ncbi:MAG TPA: tetratricopeptide repeat protein [Pirellulaceae bacterium]|nr:tetratricopeptide repeat protein [Pirellulaceae bacterium]
MGRSMDSVVRRAAERLLVAFVLLTAHVEIARAQEPADDPIERWIARLGSDSPAERSAAQRKLLQAGNEAYDPLLAASRADDVEIRLAARSLLDHLRISWVRPNDPPEVAAILEPYGDRPLADRAVDLQRLARLPDALGWPALARIVRFEPSDVLARRAAIRLLEVLPERPRVPDEPDEPEANPHLIATERELRVSPRPAARWVIAWLDWRRDPVAGLPEFEEVVRREFESLPSDKGSEAERRRNALALMRRVAEMRIASQEIFGPASLDDLAAPLTALVDDDEPSVKEHLDWLAHLGRHADIVAWSRLTDDGAPPRPEILFRIAEAQWQLGADSAAEGTISTAIEACSKGFEEGETIAHALHAFGYSRSACRLIESLHQRAVPGTDEHWRTGIDLVQWHREGLRYAAAYALLSSMIERAESRSDGWIAIRRSTDREWLRGELAWLAALNRIPIDGDPAMLSADELTLYIADLDRALEYRPEDAVLLAERSAIAERFEPGDAARWHARIAERCEQLRTDVSEAEVDLGRFPVASVRFRLERELSERSSELAELLLTDEKRLDEALVAARRAVTRAPERAEFRLILARALAAHGEWDAAIAEADRAIEQAPTRLAWQRQREGWERTAQRAEPTLR